VRSFLPSQRMSRSAVAGRATMVSLLYIVAIVEVSDSCDNVEI